MSTNGRAVLIITDGTPVNTIDLLSRRFGYLLCDWRPARSQFEFIQNKNWFSGVETPASMIQKPHVESMTFSARHNNADALIVDEQKFSRILKFANLYWTGNPSVTRPFYIVAKSKEETNLRYAPLFTAQLHDDVSPFAAPFFQKKPASTELIVPMTHGAWLDYAPGKGGLAMYENVNSTSFSSLTFKTQGTYFIDDDARIFLTNSFHHANIYYLFRGPDATNWLEQPEDVGYELTAGGGDYTYFGVGENPSAPWRIDRGWPGLWFNIITPAVFASGDPAWTWQIYLETSPGVFAWTTVAVEDGTNGFTQPGTVQFNDNNLPWGLATVNQKSGRWVRFIEASGIITQNPAVGLRHPSATVLPHFNVLLAADEGSALLDPQVLGAEEVGTQEFQEVDNVWLDFDFQQTSPDAFPLLTTLSLEGSTGLTPSVYTFMQMSFSSPFEIVGWTTERVLNTQWIDREGRVAFQGSAEIDGIVKRAYTSCMWKAVSEIFKAVPEFSVDKFVVEVGETITFDTSKTFIDAPGKTIDYSYINYGDGNSETLDNALIPGSTYAYTEPGRYSVQLFISFIIPAVGVQYVTADKYYHIKVIQPVAASFEVASSRGFSPFNPGFDATNTLSENPITSYDWHFGDGTTGTGVKPVKVYDVSGVYSVTLTVTDNAANTDTITKTHFIYVDALALYPGDDGMFLKLGFKPMLTSWSTSSPNRMYIGAKPHDNESIYRFEGMIPIYGGALGADPGWNQPTGIKWSLNTGANLIKNSKAYTGYSVEIDHSHVASGEEEKLLSLIFDNRIYNTYKGTYRVFIRIGGLGTGFDRGDIYFSAGVSSESASDDFSNALNRTRRVSEAIHDDYISLINLGSVTLGGREAVSQLLDIFWQPFVSPTSQKIAFYDVVLVPQDVWFTELSFPSYRFNYGTDYELVISSVTPDGQLEAKIIRPDVGWLENVPISIPNLPLSFVGKDLQFTVLSANYEGIFTQVAIGIPALRGDFDYAFEMSTISKVNKYSSGRGNR